MLLLDAKVDDPPGRDATDDDDGTSRRLPRPVDAHAFPPPVRRLDSPDTRHDTTPRPVHEAVIDAHLHDPRVRDDGLVVLAKHSAACPGAYAGLASDDTDDASDEVASAQSARAGPVNPHVYASSLGTESADPRARSMSRMVVLRDHACRASVPPQSVRDAVVACVVEYPDRYVDFVRQFVDAAFGESMRAFLQHTAALVTDGMASDAVRRVETRMGHLLAGPPAAPDAQKDHTLLSREEEGGEASHAPRVSLQSCLDDHASTYAALASCCNGFATSPDDAVWLLEYADLCGRHDAEDELLLRQRGRGAAASVAIDYSRVACHVPLNFCMGREHSMRTVPYTERTRRAAADDVPSCHPHVHANLRVPEFECGVASGTSRRGHVHVPLMRVPVGEWLGDDDDEEEDGEETERRRTGTHAFRWGFGHAATTMPMVRGTGAYSNYFTPYVVDAAASERSVDAERYPLSVGVCTEWGPQLFNRPERWGFGARPRGARPRGGDDDDAERETVLEAERRVHARVRPATTRLRYLGPGDFANDPLLDADEMATPLPPEVSDDPSTSSSSSIQFPMFRHNHDHLEYVSERHVDFEAVRRLDRCVSVDRDGVVSVSDVLVRQQLADAAADAASARAAVRLYHTGRRSGRRSDDEDDGSYVDDDGFRAVALSYVRGMDGARMHRFDPSPRAPRPALGSTNDAALEMRLAHVLTNRSIGMHAAHFLWADVCSQPQNSTPLPRAREFLSRWRAETPSSRGFAWKLARLLHLYVDVVDERHPGSLVDECSRVGAHRRFAGRYGSRLRRALRTRHADLLPLMVPRCFVGGSSTPDEASKRHVGSLESYLVAARCLSMRCAVSRPDQVLLEPTARLGEAWLALYSTCRRSCAVHNDARAWPPEYEALKDVLPVGTTDVLRDDGLPSYRAHLARVLPEVTSNDVAPWRETLRDPRRLGVFQLDVGDGGGGTRMRSLLDHHDLPVSGSLRDVDALPDATGPSSAAYPLQVLFPPTWCFAHDASDGRTTGQSMATMRAYVEEHMLSSLRDAHIDRDFVDDLERQIRRVYDVSFPVGRGPSGGAAADRAAVVEGMRPWAATAWEHFRAADAAHAYSLDLIRQCGLHSATQREHAVCSEWRLLDRLRTHDHAPYEPEGDSRPRISEESMVAYVSNSDPDLFARDIHADEEVFARCFGTPGAPPPETLIDDVAAQCVSVSDYALQMRSVVAEIRHVHPAVAARMDAHGRSAWQAMEHLVNDLPLATRIVAELDMALGVERDEATDDEHDEATDGSDESDDDDGQPRTAADHRRSHARCRAVLRSPIIRLLDGLTGGQLVRFFREGIPKGVAPTTADGGADDDDDGMRHLPGGRFRGQEDDGDASHSASAWTDAPSSFYVEDDGGIMFARRVALTARDVGRSAYGSGEVHHLPTTLAAAPGGRARGTRARPVVEYLNPHSDHGALMFAMLDAAALAWHKRAHYNPSDATRCVPRPEFGLQQDGVHYTIRYLMESFVHSREEWTDGDDPWEVAVRSRPSACFPSDHLGRLCHRSWAEEHPSLARRGGGDERSARARDRIERLRRLALAWVETDDYAVGSGRTSRAWAPLPLREHHDLLRAIGCFDDEREMPRNPWTARDGRLADVYRVSHHAAYAPSDRSSVPELLRRRKAVLAPRAPTREMRPFAFFGGERVLADFVRHRVEAVAPDASAGVRRAHERLVRARFGTTERLRVAAAAAANHDDERLQTLCLPDGRGAHVRVSSFLAYARNHALMALGGGDDDDDDATAARVRANFLETYASAAARRGDGEEEAPLVMGYTVSAAGRPVFVASTVACVATLAARVLGAQHPRVGEFARLLRTVALVDRRAERLARYEDAWRRRARDGDAASSRDDDENDAEARARYFLRLALAKDAQLDRTHQILMALLAKAGFDVSRLLPARHLDFRTVDEDRVAREADKDDAVPKLVVGAPQWPVDAWTDDQLRDEHVHDHASDAMLFPYVDALMTLCVPDRGPWTDEATRDRLRAEMVRWLRDMKPTRRRAIR